METPLTMTSVEHLLRTNNIPLTVEGLEEALTKLRRLDSACEIAVKAFLRAGVENPDKVYPASC